MIDKRRKEILKILYNAKNPISGTELGDKFNVSRQVIVQDIAILRAEGEDIMATPRGYIMIKQSLGIIKKIVSQHNKSDELEDELRIIVNNGGKIIDVIVEHPVYGEITANLDLKDNKDIDIFIDKISKAKGKPLSALTDGLHIHNIEVNSEEDYNKIKAKLFEKNYLKK